MSYIKVEENKTLVRDTRTGAILNTDIEALKAYRRRMSATQGQEDRISNLENTIEELKSLINNMLNERK